MAHLVRFGVSMDAELLAAFDGMLARKGYSQRSEAIRDLVRRALVTDIGDEAQAGPQTAALCVVHDQGLLDDKLAPGNSSENIQIKASMNVALDGGAGLSVVIVSGSPADLQEMAGKVLRGRGVRDGQLVPLAAKWG